MSEGTNWKNGIIFLMLIGGWFGFDHYRKKQQDLIDNPPKVEKAKLERQYAFDICVEVCQGANKLIVSVLTKQGLIDPRPENALGPAIDDLCWNDCNNRIAP